MGDDIRRPNCQVIGSETPVRVHGVVIPAPYGVRIHFQYIVLKGYAHVEPSHPDNLESGFSQCGNKALAC